MTDIEKEYAAAVGNITAADLDKFEKLRVRREIAGGLLLRLPPVGKLTIQAFNDGSLQPHESGKAAYITPFLEGDDLLDLIAWRPGSKMFSRTGIASLIGGDAIAKPRAASAATDGISSRH